MFWYRVNCSKIVAKFWCPILLHPPPFPRRCLISPMAHLLLRMSLTKQTHSHLCEQTKFYYINCVQDQVRSFFQASNYVLKNYYSKICLLMSFVQAFFILWFEVPKNSNIYSNINDGANLTIVKSINAGS